MPAADSPRAPAAGWYIAAGAIALLGLAAAIGTFLAQRREIARLKRTEPSREPPETRIAAQPPAAEG